MRIWFGVALVVLLSGCDTLSYQYGKAQQRIADSLRTEPSAAPRKSHPGSEDGGDEWYQQSLDPSLRSGKPVRVYSEARLVSATGYAPISAQPGGTAGQRMLNAMRASKLRAYQELAAIVHGQYLFGTTRVEDMVLASDRFDAAVAGIIRGARVVKSYPVQEDTYATILELDLRDVQRAYIDMQ